MSQLDINKEKMVKVVNPLTPMKEKQKTFYPELEIIQHENAPQNKIYIMTKESMIGVS